MAAKQAQSTTGYTRKGAIHRFEFQPYVGG
jgi:hypothetical protein